MLLPAMADFFSIDPNAFEMHFGNTINAALRRMGFGKDEMCGHGFRAAASSMLNESGKWNADAIEAQLAHVDNSAVRRAYQRAEFWERARSDDDMVG